MKHKILQFLPDKLFVFLKNWGWQGDFSSWKEAENKSTGYSDDLILEKVKTSLLKVKCGEAVYERDSVLFDKIEYSWELLSALMWIAAQNKGSLHVIDFGGSLGSTYYQNKIFLDSLTDVSWNIVEQPNYVKVGLESFQDDRLHFYTSIDDCYQKSKEKINTILFSSVLQYMERPYEILESCLSLNIEFIIIDRTGFTLNNKDRITLQKVPSKIYEATYPCWFFGEEKWRSFFRDNRYELIASFDALDKVNILSKYKGFIFRNSKSQIRNSQFQIWNSRFQIRNSRFYLRKPGKPILTYSMMVPRRNAALL
ncbi:MAG: methyltransferase, TIGR04325 family [Tannerella sp.]|jgi:putative methyltransferase (TIGR04325 family)|nr:methyltransferase, TIGR04325 family [Tannerella sp.]